jgi:DMSO/TMAO reductase YedYZ molybdopterin-dependent catalytic subunit
MKNFALWDVLAGLLAMAVALGVAEFVTGAVQGTSLVAAVGEYIIDSSPGDVTKAAIDLLGTKDKPALVVAIIVVSLGLGGAAGALGRRNFTVGVGVFAALGVVGALAGAADPLSSGSDATITAAISSVAGVAALKFLLRSVPSVVEAAPSAAAEDLSPERGEERRRFLRLSAGALGVAVVSALTGRWVFGPAVDVEGARAAVVLPEADPPELDSPDVSGAVVSLKGVSPLITPNEQFYRIDTALTVPRVDIETWRLRFTGLVDNPFEITYGELLEMASQEETVTLACVSNEVGGDLVGNATWLGVPLATLLERAGVQPEGTQVVARSVDRFTTAFPTAVALDGRASMVAVAMNGEVLPAAHGFPARTIVPGLYGYVSGTKWLEEIELTRLEDFGAYWITRGWAKEAPIKTQSRFDVPERGGSVDEGLMQLGGVAWGGNRGVSRVEVRFAEEKAAKEAFGDYWTRKMDPDYGDWQEARLSGALSSSSWRQWVVDWDATPGYYRVDVRATDGLGDTQTHLRQPPAPDGATGYHGFNITVHEV